MDFFSAFYASAFYTVCETFPCYWCVEACRKLHGFKI